MILLAMIAALATPQQAGGREFPQGWFLSTEADGCRLYHNDTSKTSLIVNYDVAADVVTVAIIDPAFAPISNGSVVDSHIVFTSDTGVPLDTGSAPLTVMDFGDGAKGAIFSGKEATIRDIATSSKLALTGYLVVNIDASAEPVAALRVCAKEHPTILPSVGAADGGKTNSSPPQ